MRHGIDQIPHDVLALVPLTALDQGLGSEHRLNGGAQPLGSVDDTEEPMVNPYATHEPLAQEGRTDPLVLRRRLDETQDLLLSLERDDPALCPPLSRELAGWGGSVGPDQTGITL
jgi:hypothetical protein